MAAVAFDAKFTTQSSAGSNPTNINTLTVGSGINRALLVIIAFRATAGNPCNSLTVTWDPTGANQTLTLIESYPDPDSNNNVGMWGLVNPVSGNKTLRVAGWTSGTNYIDAISVTNADQTGGATTFRNVAHNKGLSTGPSVVITSATDDMVVAQFVGSTSGGTVNSVDHTTIYTGGASARAAANYSAGAASVTLGCTLSASDFWTAQGVSILAAPTVSDLTATDIAVAAPTLGSPSLVANVILTATSISNDAPTVDTIPAFTFVGGAGAVSLSVLPPTLGVATLGQKHVLVAAMLSVGAPQLSSPLAWYALSATGLTVLAPSLGVSTLGPNRLTASNLSSAAPTLGSPTLHLAFGLAAGNFNIAPPILSSSALLVRYNLIASSLTTSWPQLQSVGAYIPPLPPYAAVIAHRGTDIKEMVTTNINADIDIMVSPGTVVGRTSSGRGLAEAVPIADLMLPTAYNALSLPAGLPAGTIAQFTNCTINTLGSPVSGSGPYRVLAWYNGVVWTIIGI
jgi:hypothetical protein